MKLSLLIPVKLHKDEVPEFQIAVAVTSHTAIRTAAADPFSLVDDDLRAGTAGTGLPHGPEIVFLSQPDDPVLWNADLSPEMEGLIVFEIDGDPHLLLGQSPLTDEKVPPHLNGTLFEIIAEGEIAEHLKKGMVPCRYSDIFEIVMFPAGTNAFLGGGGPDVVTGLFGEKDPFELNHPGIGEEQGGIVLRNEGRARHNPVSPLCEIVEKGSSNLI